MEFEVVFVDDERMPVGHDWALARVGERFYALIRATRVVPEVLAAAWAAFVARVGEVSQELLGSPHPLDVLVAFERQRLAVAG